MQVDIKDSTKDDFLYVDLAPSFGMLDSKSIQGLDDQVKVMIAGTMRALQVKRKAGPLLWDDIMSTLMQNSLLEPGDGEIDRADKLIQPGGNPSKLDAAGVTSTGHLNVSAGCPPSSNGSANEVSDRASVLFWLYLS